jgi:hypothetical protein
MQHRAFASILALACACGGNPDPGVSPDAPPQPDARPGCAPSGVSETEATRATDAAAVTASALLRNALEHCAKPELTFGLVFDTHSVVLLGLDIPAAARVQTSAGAMLSGGFVWTPGSESSHHRDGLLTVTAPPLAGVTWLRLTVVGVAGVDRAFEWDASLLAHDLP